MKKLTDRTAVVTGAGSGIGRATSVLLAQRGCRLALADIQEEGLAETARLVRELGRPVTTHKVDVSDKARMQEFATEVVDAHGGVHILINNAGVAVVANFKDHSLEDFEWLMGINFWGVVYGCKFFLPHLSLAEEGHIVNISSLFGLMGIPQQTSYCSSKFAVRGFSESLRIELASSNVGVTSVHPGGIATRIVADARLSGDAQDPKAHARMVKSFKKMMPPSEAALCILRGIERNKPRVLITRESYIADVMKRLSPALSTDLFAWGYERMQHMAQAKALAKAQAR
ncbi:MAG: short-chain dehydrogenase/reductase [Myxococcaceae bacterium]|nr:short-chain dehydrogenase/reductase [Myxococcaceae bacterium]